MATITGNMLGRVTESSGLNSNNFGKQCQRSRIKKFLMRPPKRKDNRALFTEKQLQVIQEDLSNSARITLLEGAVRTGKTYLALWLWLKHINSITRMGFVNVKFIMTGFTVPSLQKNVLDDMYSIFGIDTTLNDNNEFKCLGQTICCFGADKHHSFKSMRGMTAYGWYGNEATLQHLNTYREAMQRCSGVGARIILDTNPDCPNHHIYKELITKNGEMLNSGKRNIASHHFRLDDNTFLNPDYIESLKKTTPSGMWYDRNIEGLWVAADGLIYKDFNAKYHVVNPNEIPNIKSYFMGMDWGFEHYGALILFGLAENNAVFALEEVYEREKGMDFWTDMAKRYTRQYGYLPIYCDTARPEFLREFKKAGTNAKMANKNVIEGITFVATLIKNSRYFISSKCKNLIREKQAYVWNQTSLIEKPIEKDDDTQDAERYALFSHLNKAASILTRYK